MKKLLRTLYDDVLPQFIRNRIIIARTSSYLKQLRNDIINYYSTLPNDQLTNEHRQVIQYLRNNPIYVFPYSFRYKYKPNQVKVHYDEKRDLRYVLMDGKRLYFKRSLDDVKIQKIYSSLLTEQDIDSPHRYLVNDFQVSEKDVVVDVGAAEGNFSLSIIEKAAKVHLFEADPEWAEALNATFSPWEDKVVIINKFVSDRTADNHIRLDDYFNSTPVDFLKIDVEGVELSVLKGAGSILSGKRSLKIALCCYHKQEDAELFEVTLKQFGFAVQFSKGYMIFYHDKTIAQPYLRRGLIRATRN